MTEGTRKDSNPLDRYRKTRHRGGVLWYVDARSFDQVYDYALQLQGQLSGEDEKSLFQAGNILKSLARTSSMPLYVMVTGNSGSVSPDSFMSIVLLDISEWYDLGDRIHVQRSDKAPGFSGLAWELSSIEEVADAKRVG